MGDGMLFEFPSVVAAVECAITVQLMMAERNTGGVEAKRILYRIGVNVGDILIEGEDIIGEGVNVAARLEAMGEPAGICLSGAAYEQVRGRIGAEFADLGERELKNIPRPVRIYALTPSAIAGVDAAAPRPAADRGGGASRSEGAEPPYMSLVVLPFANIGGDPEQEHFVDGVTESLITDLARITPTLVGRNTAFTYRGRQVDLRQVGRELNVRYIVEGGVQRVGERVRVSARFIDAESGNLIWADRFDKLWGMSSTCRTPLWPV
jgi:TolB-like protein